MKIINIVGLTAAAIVIAVTGSPVSAADLGGPGDGSLKDGPYAGGPTVMRAAPGPCYFRGDVGYSWSRSPGASWPVTDVAAPVAPATNPTYTYVGDSVTNTELKSTAFGGLGLGCGTGSRGFRGEIMLEQTGNRDFTGVPLNYSNTVVTPTTYVDPMHTSVKSTTLMFNGYKDLGSFGNLTPYVGAGVGVAYNRTGDVSFTGNPNLTNQIQGESRMSLAWALMAGVGYQISDRAILDLGYRYMDYGKAQSGQVDNLGFVNPAVRINDITAHEFKVGLRYYLGAADSAPAYQPLK